VAISEVEPIFAAFGTVARCVYVEDSTCSMTSINTKTALVEYNDSQTAATVALSMKNFNLAGFPLVVQMISSEQAMQLVPSPTPAAIARAAAAAFAASVSASMPLSVAANPTPTSLPPSSTSSSTTDSTSPTPVRYKSLKLLNMVSVDELQDPDLKEEIAEEVRKYGQLLDIQFYVAPNNSNNSATVALRYATEEDTLRAYQALQDRAFANKKIVATLAP